MADFERLTREAKEGDRLTVLLQRGPMSLYVAFTRRSRVALTDPPSQAFRKGL